MPNRFQSAFDGLASLGAGDEPGVRPVILRVLADLFVTRAHHAPVEIAQFEEIACRLVDKADAETCEIVARKLVAHEGAPQRVLEALARVSATVRELDETSHQFEAPFELDSRLTERIFGLAPTPWSEALTATVATLQDAPVAAATRLDATHA